MKVGIARPRALLLLLCCFSWLTVVGCGGEPDTPPTGDDDSSIGGETGSPTPMEETSAPTTGQGVTDTPGDTSPEPSSSPMDVSPTPGEQTPVEGTLSSPTPD